MNATRIPRCHRVALTGVVTYWDPVWSLLFVQDHTAGIFVLLSEKPPSLNVGTRVRIVGETSPGHFAPEVSGARVRQIGTGRLPRPLRLAADRLLTGFADSQWIEVQGLVRSLARGDQGHGTMQLAVGGRVIDVVFPPGYVLQDELVDAWVSVRGVCGTRFNQRRQLTGIQLFAGSAGAITLDHRAARSAELLPLQPISELLQFTPDDDHPHRRRTHGTITYVHKDVAFVTDGEASLQIRATGRIAAAVGDQVQLVGFPVAGRYGPELEGVAVLPFALGGPPDARAVTAAEVLRDEHHGALVRVGGRLLDAWRHDDSSLSMLLQADGHLLTATLADAPASISLPRVGSAVLVSGIAALASNAASSAGGQPYVRLLMRTADDLTVMRPASWWTTERTLAALGVSATVGIAAAAWVLVLRRRLRRQTVLIAEKLRREAALEENYRRIVEDAYDAIWTADGDDRIVRVNEAAERLTGYGRVELAGRWVLGILFDGSRPAYRAAREALEQGEVAPFELELVTKAGTRVPIEISLRRTEHNDGSVEAVVRDISTRKALEEQLRHSQKMEAVGRLAGGVAHDFNNLLTAIMGYTDLAAGEAGDGPIREWLNEVKKASTRAASLTQQLLAFARRQVFTPRTVNLNDVIADTRGMLERIIGEDIILRTDLGDVPRVHLDAGQFGQVLMNLVVNARDAMPQGGEITIRSFAERRANGTYALVTVQDTGSGIPEAVLPHIFEPFFTTKDIDKGTGLGLAVCYGILAQAGGSIAAQSSGSGTVFTIEVPARPAPESFEICSPRSAPVSSHGTETILVVEDEEQVRELACHTLRAGGYTVISAANAEAAVAKWEAAAASIDLLLTDVVMPSRSGPELAADLRARKPALKVLYVSGYADSRHTPLDASELLSKPYEPGALLSRIRSTLDGAPTVPAAVV